MDEGGGFYYDGYEAVVGPADLRALAVEDSWAGGNE